MDDKDQEEGEEKESENLRELILQQLANLDSSDGSTDESYKVRLSCILEDDESEGSAAAAQKEPFFKDERTKESEKGPPEIVETLTSVQLGESLYDSELSDDFACENVQITDLDDVALGDPDKEKTEEVDKTDENASEETNDESEKNEGFAIKKLKSSDNVHKRPFVIRRRELSSDSSDLDISVTEGPSSDLKIVEMTEPDDEATLNAAPDYNESEDEPEEKIGDARQDREASGEVEVVDNETLSSIFAKVSRTYLEKTKSNVKWEENEKIEKVFKEMMEEKTKGREFHPGELSFSDVHIRGTSPKEYNPPVPPETYLWEELKRLRERGGYPWTYLDKPPFDEATWKKYMEHVYEPINPPPLSMERKSDATREVATSKGSSIPETDKQTIRTPTEPDIGKKELLEKSKDSEEMEVEEITSAQNVQDDLENRFLTLTPTATTATTASQSRTDITSSVLDSSGFEDLPVKSSTLAKTRREHMRAQAREIQQRLRNHAGRIREKFNNLPKPSLPRKERLKREKPAEKSKFRLPEMHTPKISLPERGKFKFPEKAKFHLPDRSKFRLPEKGKFHLPERPKLNLAERAKIHFPERGKFHLPDKSKFHLPDKSKFHLPDKSKFHLPESAKFHLPDKSKFHLPETAKFHLPDKSKFHLPETTKFHLPDKSKFHLPETAKFHFPEKAKLHFPDTSKFHFPEKAKFNLPSRSKIELPSFGKGQKDGQTSSPKSLKSKFEFDLKSYPKLFTKHSKDYTTSSPKQTRGRTPPPRMKQTEAPAQSSKWIEKLDDLKYADDDLEEAGIKETDSRKSESLFEREGYMEDFEKIHPEVRTLSTKSSASHLSDKELQSSESLNFRKKGVLEEINPDEFFLRQKGISQDDIDMGKYLSREIREAFRSPDVNALAKMDYIDVEDENLDPRLCEVVPKRPKRSGSVKKKSILKKASKSDPSISDDGYKTYPPRRSGKKSRSQSKSLLNEDAAIIEPEAKYEEADVNLSRYDNVEYDEDNVSEYYKTPGSAREYQHYKVPRSHAPVEPSPSVKRRAEEEEETSHKRIHEEWQEEEFQMSEPPKPMARRKHKKKMVEEVESIGDERIPQEITGEPEEIVSQSQIVESPIPPKRTKVRSSGSRSLRSLATEDEVSRSFHSEPPIERLEEIESEIIPEERLPTEEGFLVKSVSEFIPTKAHEYEITDLDDVGFGYATVGKPTVTKPERHKKQKPERPPPPRKKREISMPIYNTYPRRTPVRPLRNYSTLGPSRPPRQKKVSPIEKAVSQRQIKTYAEIKPRPYTESLDIIEVSGSSKDLQTEKVIEKMKGRPLPPPPRPPRQKSKGPEDDLEPTEEEKLSLSIIRDEEFPLERKVTAFVHEPPPEKETVEEICVSTQTDPLPDDFLLEGEESDMIQEFSHEQLRIQQAFLEEMKKEEEEMRQRGRTNENDLVDAELKAEVIRQIEDIIAEEKRILEERKSDEKTRKEESFKAEVEAKEPKRSHLDVDADMGYASLERRGHRQEPQPPSTQDTAQNLPSKIEKLQLKELEVETINVHEVQSDQIFVKELQSNRIASPDIDNTGGSIVLGNVDLPDSFIDQIVAKIPWETLRKGNEANAALEPSQPRPPVRPHRRQRGPQQDGSEEESPLQSRKTHRRQHRAQYSSDEEDTRSSETRIKRIEERRQLRAHREDSESPRIPELSLQLARMCTSAGVQALKSFLQTNVSVARTLDRELCVQVVLCIAIALVAGFFIFGFDAKIVHLHRWDFQFPPQPPNAGF